jgi:fucose permease
MTRTTDPAALFRTARIALLATAFCFASVAAALGGIKAAFALTNTEAGLIAGAALWGLAVGQLILSPLCDVLGFRRMLLIAAALQIAGVFVMIAASGFVMLMAGATLISIGNGAVEAACNPLVAALFPDRKAAKLNHFHLWFPGGIAIGGVLTYALDQGGVGAWQAKIALILVPALAYLAMTLRQSFPPTETRAAGIGLGDALKATAVSPLMWLMLVLMAITASLELGPNRWVPSVIEAGGLPGILVLVFINGIMALLRGTAEPVLARVSPTVVLLVSTLLAAAGLMLIAEAKGLAAILAASAVFACGVAFLWPMMVGVVAERLPRTGATGLGLIAAVGAAFVGGVTTPLMGGIADREVQARVDTAQVMKLASDVAMRRSELIAAAPERRRAEIAALADRAEGAGLDGARSVSFARALIATDPSPDLTARASAILAPIENAGGLASFAQLVPFALAAALAFLTLILIDRRRGGYAAAVERARATLQTKDVIA